MRLAGRYMWTKKGQKGSKMVKKADAWHVEMFTSN
jgi:hypothetical protein